MVSAKKDTIKTWLDCREKRRAGNRVCLSACLLLGWAASDLRAEDWPQWRGVDRAAVWNDTGVVARFPDDGLTVTWRAPVRAGFAGPAVAGGRVFVLDYDETEPRTMDGTERLIALDENTGEVLWTHEWTTTYRMLMFTYATGPRATPTVDGDRVYVTGSTGRILCLNAETGVVLWEKDTVAEYDTNIPIWGTSSAPLIDDDRVIFLIGGEPDALVMAFDKYTGKEVWRERIAWEQEIQGRKLRLEAFRAAILRADGHYLCLSELGSLLWLDLNPKGHKILASSQLFFAPGTWTLPVVSRGLLYVMQNETDRISGSPARIICYDLRGR